jgi:hypothetical protein
MICFASESDANQCASRHSNRSVPLNDSTYALIDLQSYEVLLSPIEGLLCNPYLPAHLYHWHTHFGLLQNCHDLFY